MHVQVERPKELAMTTVPRCSEELSVALTGRDIWVIRLGLKTLLAESTRHEHIYHDIHTALARLPEAHEPRSSECDCFDQSDHDAASVSAGQSPA